LLHGDRWTDAETDIRDEANSAFRNFANATKNKHNFSRTIYIPSFNKQQINPAV